MMCYINCQSYLFRTGFRTIYVQIMGVDDVAEGHMLALERGAVGQSYTLGGQNATLEEMLAVIASLAGRRAPRVKLPRMPLFPLAYAAEAVARLTGREP